MEAIIESLGTNIYESNGHKGYLILWKLISPFCKKWSRNRDPDMERVKEVYDYYMNHSGYVPNMIHLAELPDEGLVCYDGNHRREVFNMGIAQGSEIICIVDIMFDTTQRDVYKAFTNLNKSVQVPAIYIDEGENNETIESTIKLEIIALVKHYETQYKSFLSTSPRYHAPNFNRDALVDNIYAIYKSFNKTVTISEIGKLLTKLNTEYSQGRLCRPHSSYRTTLLEKCRKHNMWLFIERAIPFEHMELVLNMSV